MARQRRTLPEAAVDQLLASESLRVEDNVVWSLSGGRVRAQVSVGGLPQGLKAVIDLGVSVELPGKYSFNLRLEGGQVLRRLDVRGSHTNPTPGAREKWRGRTHKHIYRDDVADACAYTPTDVPFGSRENLGTVARPDHTDEYRQAFAAFCTECGIELVGAWSDPSAALAHHGRMRVLGEAG